jgi:transketolase
MERDIATRVVSMPSWELFEEQPREYRDHVLPPRARNRLAIEAGSTLGWSRYTGDEGDVIGVEGFGASGPGSELLKKYGFTTENIVKRSLAMMGKA